MYLAFNRMQGLTVGNSGLSRSAPCQSNAMNSLHLLIIIQTLYFPQLTTTASKAQIKTVSITTIVVSRPKPNNTIEKTCTHQQTQLQTRHPVFFLATTGFSPRPGRKTKQPCSLFSPVGPVAVIVSLPPESTLVS